MPDSNHNVIFVKKTNVAEPDPVWVASRKYEHVWQHKPSGKWVYEDETNQLLEETMFDTAELANDALSDYVTFSLDDGIDRVLDLLNTVPGVKELSSVQSALALLAQREGAKAIMTLRADNDKIRGFSKELSDLVINRPKINIG